MDNQLSEDADLEQQKSDVFAAIVEFISANTPTSDEITTDTPLLESGMLDSIGILQLMMFLGDSQGITIEDEDFAPENFGTVGDLLNFVIRKRQAAS